MSDQFDSSKSEMIMTNGDEEFERPVAINLVIKLQNVSHGAYIHSALTTFLTIRIDLVQLYMYYAIRKDDLSAKILSCHFPVLLRTC